MAIVEMKHVDMLALESDRQPLLEAIQKLGCIQLLQADAEDVTFNRALPTAELPTLEDAIARAGWAIQRLTKFDTSKKPLMADKPLMDENQAKAVLELQPRLMETVERLETLERETGDLRGQIARLDATAEQLEPWKGLTLAPSEIRSTHNTVAVLGTVQKAALERWQAEGILGDLCVLEQVAVRRDAAYVYALYHKSEREHMQALFKQGNFAPVTLPQGNRHVDEMLDDIARERAEYLRQQQDVGKQTADLVENLAPLKQLYDVLLSRKNRLVAAESFSKSEHTFFLQGWVPAPVIPTLEKEIKRISPTAVIHCYDPTEEEEPPVVLHNNPMATPFESVVRNFSLPAPRSVDPTAIMAPFYVNFMGMMISDAGYGLMMALLIPIMIKVLKPSKSARNMLWLLAAGGVATLFWGAMYNSWFGFAPWPSVFDPMNNALPVMAVCIGLGALHLFAGLGMAAYLNIRRGQVLDAIVDQLSWFVLIVGLALLAVAPSVGQWMALAGALTVIVFAGRAKSKNPIKRIISGLGALYGITSWVSDLLSYIRLFGMGLATGVIGMVINILVRIAMSYGPVGIVMGALVFVAGHAFNAGINVFGAYVHSCRLQYIEFFGKFYEDGGKPFKPLTHSDRYYTIRPDNA